MSADDDIWVKTELDPLKDSYHVTIEIGQDRAIGITPAMVVPHVNAIFEVVQRAEYDAAVLKQLRKLGVHQDAIGQLLVDMRKDRPPVDQSALAPMSMEPGVNKFAQPFIVVSIDGKQVGQWWVKDAREHANAVIEAVFAADLDTGYYRALTGFIGLDGNRASQAIADLGRFRG